jgi:hypothetical protein
MKALPLGWLYVFDKTTTRKPYIMDCGDSVVDACLTLSEGSK